VIHYAVSQASLEMAIDASIYDGALSVEPIHDAIIDVTDLRVDVVDDPNDDVMRIRNWRIGLGRTGTQAQPCRSDSRRNRGSAGEFVRICEPNGHDHSYRISRPSGHLDPTCLRHDVRRSKVHGDGQETICRNSQ
jgi:hypothetical protein